MLKQLVNIFSLSTFLFFTTLQADTLFVTNLNDSGTGSLREAITNATSFDTIECDSALSGTISLESPLPTISIPMFINGPDSKAVTVDGNGDAMFDVQAYFVFITKLNLSNGIQSGGGGIVTVDLNHSITLTDLTVTISEDTDGENPLLATIDGQINLSDVTFSTDEINAVYLDTGNLAIESTGSSQVVVNGSGQVVTAGTGTIEIIAGASPADLTIIANDGPTVIFSGTTSNSVVINDGGFLYGNFTTPNVASGGTLKPGTPTTIGTCISTGDTYQSSDATLQIKIDPSGDTDEYLIGGAMYMIGGTLTLLPESGTYLENTVYSFLLTEGGLVGEFDTVTYIPGLYYDVVYNLHSIDIVITDTSTI